MADEKPSPTTSVKIKTVPRVYLVDKNINTTSMQHTARIGDPQNMTILYSLDFWRGVARDVPLALYERFRDAGVATTERPSTRRDEE